MVALAIVAYAAMNWPAPPPEPPDLSPVVFLDTPSDRAYESSGLGDAFGTAGSVLMDGNIGTRDPKKDPPGTWVAFIGQSAQLTIDRLESGPFSHVRVGFLERDSYWVVGPTEVRVSVADQNNVEAWYLAGIWSPMDRREEPFRFWQAHKRGEIVVNIDARAQGRYVRLEIASPETRTRPEYETRLGSVWIALDEVVID